MNRTFCSLLAATFLVGSSTPLAFAEPGGCLKYGAAGAVAGHVAKRHGVLGAVGGCAVGMYQRHKYRKNLRQKAAAWDKEHANDPQANKKATLAQKGQWYDAEQTPAKPASGQASATPAAAQ
ncbi:hypothetical protein [Saccharibacter floricola]|uniref:Uncharacterized protein n=1 Tax=Saccharibacter floricola DSM 15669 TaxID=1123227 RepID=A0ABQ0NYU4_9PROT|nr:hypothetical protein [Saccharibacter floricola]GBQ06395.1 hypothetical protein AA15669_0920 [Saccharibacter floricola DSM 15669]